MKKRALVSVYDKSGVLELAAFLDGAGWELLSTGGTARYLREHKVPVTDVSALTGFPECLDGRVKTLHPAVHAGLLARRGDDAHLETLRKLGLGTIDLLCVNLYPFFEKVQAGLSLEETVEFIDIGGPAMLRSAAKNYPDVVALTDPADYADAIAGLQEGGPSLEFRKKLAGKVFNLTSAYDAAIARYLLETDADSAEFPAFWPVSLKIGQRLRYGENGHQRAALYLSADRPGALAAMEQLNGKELGYNNIRDLDLAWKAACAFGFAGQPPAGEDDLLRLGVPGLSGKAGGTGDGQAQPGSEGGFRGEPKAKLPAGFPPPCCVAVKHNTPCGIALGRTLEDAYDRVYACDPVSIFGGIVAATVPVDAATAAKLAELFLEIVAAPGYDEAALEILRRKKNLRVMRARRAPGAPRECVSVDGGLLVQDTDRKLFEKWEVVTAARPEDGDCAGMIFGMRAAGFVKSNAIVVVREEAAVGIGGGQTNRIWAAEQALGRAAAVTGAARARVLASDAFFPFADVVEAAAAAGIRAIIQPGGSIRDGESIAACDRHGIAMVFTGTRHFKH